MGKWETELSVVDVRWAEMIAEMIQRQAVKDKRRLEKGRTDNALDTHRLGCVAEVGASRILGHPWLPLIGQSDRERGDVGGYQIRGVVARSRKDNLQLRADNKLDAVWILAWVRRDPLGTAHVELKGWMVGTEYLDRGFYDDRGHIPCRTIPWRKLDKMSNLPGPEYRGVGPVEPAPPRFEYPAIPAAAELPPLEPWLQEFYDRHPELTEARTFFTGQLHARQETVGTEIADVRAVTPTDEEEGWI